MSTKLGISTLFTLEAFSPLLFRQMPLKVGSFGSSPLLLSNNRQVESWRDASLTPGSLQRSSSSPSSGQVQRGGEQHVVGRKPVSFGLLRRRRRRRRRTDSGGGILRIFCLVNDTACCSLSRFSAFLIFASDDNLQ